MRDELQEEMRENLKEIMREIKAAREESCQHAKDMDKRISSLERWQWTIVGGAGVLGFLFAIGFELMRMMTGT